MTINDLPDVAGANTATQILASQVKVRVLFLTASGGIARFGSSSVAVNRGVILPQNVMTRIEASGADVADSINLFNAYVYTPSGTTLTISYGV